MEVVATIQQQQQPPSLPPLPPQQPQPQKGQGRPRGLSGDAAEGVRAWAEGRVGADGEGGHHDFLFGRSKSDSLVAVPPNLSSD